MKLRSYTYVSHNSLLKTVHLPDPEPVEIPDWFHGLCDAVVQFDEPAPGVGRLTTLTSSDGREYEPVVGELPEG